MPTITESLLKAGICALPELYSSAEIEAINRLAEPILSGRSAERRAYIHSDEMVESGIFERIFSSKMKDVLFSIMPDPVLYHCHVYEIAANDTRSHIFANSLLGWHRDPDSDYVSGDPTHVSIFVYLSDVGVEDGGFEFVPGVPPTSWLHNGAEYISALGPRGYSFAWHRSYYHRASPNRGPVRRRLFKLSIQRNAFPSLHLSNPHFKKVLDAVPAGDPVMDLLLGRYQGRRAPQISLPIQIPATAEVACTGTLTLSSVDLAKSQLKDKARGVKRKLQGNGRPVVAAYD